MQRCLRQNFNLEDKEKRSAAKNITQRANDNPSFLSYKRKTLILGLEKCTQFLLSTENLH